MKTSTIVVIAAAAMLSACVSTDDDGYLTHTDYSITGSDRAIVQSTLQSKLKAPGLQMQGLQASENLSTGAVTLCGYVSAISPAGTRSPNAVFGGMFTADRRQFMIFGGEGKGQDPNRIQQVRIMCSAAGIHI